MKKYPIRNIYIDYDGIQCECYISKNKLKKVVYNCVYTKLGNDWLRCMEELNIQVGVMHGLGKDLGWR